MKMANAADSVWSAIPDMANAIWPINTSENTSTAPSVRFSRMRNLGSEPNMRFSNFEVMVRRNVIQLFTTPSCVKCDVLFRCDEL